jgi:hypothetical protein
MAPVRSLGGFRIGDGGALRRLEVKWHLTRLASQVIWFVLLTWVPIMVLGLVAWGREPLLRDPGMHVRLLVVAPVLLYLDFEFPAVCGRSVQQLLDQDFVPEAAQPQLQRTLLGATRLADSRLPELLIALLGFVVTVGSFLHRVPVTAFALSRLFTAAQIYYAVLALPLFEFLLLRSLWRWVIWVRLLVGLSRIELDLDPTHPDCRGGISFLRFPSIAYCEVLLFAIASVFCADWQGRAVFGTTIASFVPLLLMFGVVGMLVAFGPLLVFAGQLVRARRIGRIEVSGLAVGLGRRFRRRWIERTEPTPEANADDEFQGLVAVGTTYRDRVDRLYWLLFEKHDLITLAIATGSPLVVVMLARVPTEDWLTLLGIVSGGIVPYQ